MVSLQKEIINRIINIEGTYVNDPSDSGGETNYGITIKTARKYGYNGEIKNLTKNKAFEIYVNLYWKPLLLDSISNISPKLTYKLFDMGVNLGINRSSEFFQRCLNVLNNKQNYYIDVSIDGKIGPLTLNALKSFINKRSLEGQKILVNMLNCLQGNFYIELSERREKDEKFIYGWFKHRISII